MHKNTQNTTQKIIFLDRDGVINKEVNYLHKIKDFIFIDGVFEVCKYFLSLGYKIIIITNQSGIARGYYTQNDFFKLNTWMLAEFSKNNINILDVFFCPHNPDDNCNCRKPRAGMLLTAKLKHNIDMNNSWMIGDKEADIITANTAKIKQTILVRSGHKIDEQKTLAKFILNSIKESMGIIK